MVDLQSPHWAIQCHSPSTTVPEPKTSIPTQVCRNNLSTTKNNGKTDKTLNFTIKDYENNDFIIITPNIKLDRKILTIASYHPAFLLRSPNFKRASWEDLQLLQKKMEE